MPPVASFNEPTSTNMLNEPAQARAKSRIVDTSPHSLHLVGQQMFDCGYNAKELREFRTGMRLRGEK